MIKGLQEFIAELEREQPEILRREAGEIDVAHHEVAAYLQNLEDRVGSPVTIFENVRDVQGNRSQFPLVHNVFATRALCARAIGEPSGNDRMDLSIRFGELQERQEPYAIVSRSEAPVMQNVRHGQEADVTTLPAARYHEKDAGAYFVMGCLMKARSGPFYDVTMTKNMIHGPRELSVSAHGHHHLRRIIKEYEKDGLKTPIAVVLGHHPAFYLGSCAITEYGNDDYKTIGAFMGGPLRLTPSATLGDDFLIPADSEIVIEGYVLPNVKKAQNPFGEISGHYQERMNSPVMEVTAICYRNGAIMEGILPAHTEHVNLGGVPKEGSVYNAIKRVVPEVTAVHLPQSGRGRFNVYIALKKQTFRDVQVAGMIAAAEMPNMKLAVVVDSDIDVFKEEDVMWAAATQTHWDKGMSVIPRVQSFRSWLGDAVCIVDATRPEIPDFPEHNVIPAEAMERVKRFNIR